MTKQPGQRDELWPGCGVYHGGFTRDGLQVTANAGVGSGGSHSLLLGERQSAVVRRRLRPYEENRGCRPGLTSFLLVSSTVEGHTLPQEASNGSAHGRAGPRGS